VLAVEAENEALAADVMRPSEPIVTTGIADAPP
jgi:hypothetical protein